MGRLAVATVACAAVASVAVAGLQVQLHVEYQASDGGDAGSRPAAQVAGRGARVFATPHGRVGVRSGLDAEDAGEQPGLRSEGHRNQAQAAPPPRGVA